MKNFKTKRFRPILKLQHELTQFLLLNHQNYNAIRILKPKEKQYETALKKFIQTNIEFKNQLLGAVIGQFTHAELTFYMNQS